MKKQFLTILITFCSLQTYSSTGKEDHDEYEKENRWEIGADLGLSYFVGTVNLASSDFLSTYRTDGNKIGYTIQLTAMRKLNSWLYLIIEGGESALNGTVTYDGTTPDSHPVTKGDQGVYDTRNRLLAGSAGFDLLDLFGRTTYFRVLTKVGVGISKTEIIQVPFGPEKQLYDFADSNDTELTVPVGIRFSKEIDPQFSMNINWNVIFVGGSKVDGYYLSSDPINEGIPTPEGAKMSFSPDVYTSVTFGLSYRW